MTRKPLFAILAALVVLAVGCRDGGSDDADATTTTEATTATSQASTTTDGGEGGESTGAGGTGLSDELELPDGVFMIAQMTSEDSEASTITSTSEGSCSFGLFTPDTYTLSFSVLEGTDDSGHETIEGPETDGLGLDVVIEGGGSGEGTGEAGFSRADVNDFDYEYSSEDADLTVEERDDGSVFFTFAGENADGVPFNGEALCRSVTTG